MNPQTFVGAFLEENALLQSPEIHALDLVAEIGEVAKAILQASNYGRARIEPGQDIAGEHGEQLLLVARSCDKPRH